MQVLESQARPVIKVRKKRLQTDERTRGTKTKRPRHASPLQERSYHGPTLLDLPLELLTEIFLLSMNSAFPETCATLYQGLFADPRINGTACGPPLWMQKRFIENLDATILVAVQKGLRFRFFGPETFRYYCDEHVSHVSDLSHHLTIPLRCVVGESTSSRVRDLYAELLKRRLRLPSSSARKALVWFARRPSTESRPSLFWESIHTVDFQDDVLLTAFRAAAEHPASFDPINGTFTKLAARYQMSETVANELYRFAIVHHNAELLAFLRHFGPSPTSSAFRLWIKDAYSGNKQ